VDVEPNGIEAANKLADRNKLGEIASFKQLDVSQELPFPDEQFNAVMSIDVIIHIQNRDFLFTEIARVLQPRGVFAFTDAGVITGPVTDEECAARSINGLTLFHQPSYNETALRKTGFEIIDIKDSTQNLIQIAEGRKGARLKFKDELEKWERAQTFDREQLYLETIIKLATEKRLSRFTYFAVKIDT
jgi:ubiquinone/menaquinone biosynthesis C-methylase UbiE